MKESIDTEIIEEKDINDIYDEQQESEKTECKTCKQKGLTLGQWIMLSSSFYILFSSIYGTIKIIKELINYFQ